MQNLENYLCNSGDRQAVSMSDYVCRHSSKEGSVSRGQVGGCCLWRLSSLKGPGWGELDILLPSLSLLLSATTAVEHPKMKLRRGLLRRWNLWRSI